MGVEEVLVEAAVVQVCFELPHDNEDSLLRRQSRKSSIAHRDKRFAESDDEIVIRTRHVRPSNLTPLGSGRIRKRAGTWFLLLMGCAGGLRFAAANDRMSAMHPEPTWRLGHVIIAVSRATWSDSVEHLSFDVRGEFTEYLMARPSLSGTISVGTERPVERLGQRVQLVVGEDNDLSLYTGVKLTPKALSVTIEEVEGRSMRARLDGIADV